MLWIVRKRESNETLFGNLFQPNSLRSRERMQRMSGHANLMTLQFLEIYPVSACGGTFTSRATWSFPSRSPRNISCVDKS